MIQDYYYVNGSEVSEHYHMSLCRFLANTNFSYSLHVHFRSTVAFHDGFGNHYNVYFDNEDEILSLFEESQKQIIE